MGSGVGTGWEREIGIENGLFRDVSLSFFCCEKVAVALRSTAGITEQPSSRAAEQLNANKRRTTYSINGSWSSNSSLCCPTGSGDTNRIVMCSI